MEGQPRLPSAEELKVAATSENIGDLLILSMSDVTIVGALSNVGQAVVALRAQVSRMEIDEARRPDDVDIAIIESLATAELLLERMAQAAEMVLKIVADLHDKRNRARYN